jgi:hypothetical protein
MSGKTKDVADIKLQPVFALNPPRNSAYGMTGYDRHLIRQAERQLDRNKA